MALNGTAIPRKLDETLENMLHALCLLRRAGAPARFGDDDGGRLFDGQRNRAEHLLDRLATGAVLFGRGDFKFLAGGFVRKLCWLLGLNGIIRWPDGCRAFAGSHEGYCRLPQAVIHRRWVFSLKSHFWLVRDLAEGAGQHQIHLFWHTSPEPVQRKDAVRVFEFSDQQSGITLLTTATMHSSALRRRGDAAGRSRDFITAGLRSRFSSR